MSRQPSRSPARSPAPAPAASAGGNSTSRRSVLFLFDRPGEPIFLPKSDDNVVFDVPPEYLTEEFRPAREGLINRIQDNISETIKVRKITIPDITPVLSLGRRENFSLFIPHHRKLAGRLINMFMEMRTYDDLISLCVYCRDRVNPYLFVYALSVALLHRQDTKNTAIPPLFENFPEKYMDGGLFKRAREISNVIDADKRTPLEIPRDYTASDTDPEHKVAYFREDLGINLHHWHWHLVYPFDADIRIVNKDRRGELFYYMHEQIQARYNLERFSNGLPRVARLSNFREPLEEGYFPKLDSLVSSRSWPPRPANSPLKDITREIDQIKFDLSDLERWRNRLLQAIAVGFYIDEQGRNVPLDETTGVDILGNLMESSILSRNRNLYGDFHNLGHVAVALCHDPDARHLETFGVMGDPATAMRDPIFYRFHAYIDYIFQQHKATLPTYTVQQLDFPGVKITGFELLSKGRNKNEFATHWEQSDVNLSRGIDFTPRGNVFARFTHLQHAPFTYRIMIDNSSGQARSGTVRIFLAPKTDERGLPWLFNDQRTMFIELDKFTVNLKPKQNPIERKSSESSVTIPFEQTFRNLNTGRPTGGQQLDTFNMCGCGWPQHMLIAKGTPDGLPCQLFAMVSNFENDKVEQTGPAPACKDAASYCGLKDSKYPDKRSMGFPFDRQGRDGADTLRQFQTGNMMTIDVRIVHQDRTEQRRNN